MIIVKLITKRNLLHRHDGLRLNPGEEHVIVDEVDRLEALQKIKQAQEWFQRWYMESGECPCCMCCSQHDTECELKDWIKIK